MLRQLENTLTLSRAGSPAKTFWRLGWVAFWTQIGFGSLPVILVVYALIFDRHSGAGTQNLDIWYSTLTKAEGTWMISAMMLTISCHF